MPKQKSADRVSCELSSGDRNKNHHNGLPLHKEGGTRPTVMNTPRHAASHLPHVGPLIEQLRQHAPQWADRLSRAATDQEFLDVLCKLFDLSVSVTSATPVQDSAAAAIHAHSKRQASIAHFISSHLHEGPTLKTLAEWLGYSEKYCSELFRSVMGEPFSRYLARRRTEIASDLLLTTDKSIRDIAASVGFSDQFSFSHFFKRATGFSPRAFRAAYAPSRSERTARPSPSAIRHLVSTRHSIDQAGFMKSLKEDYQ
ncbi:MAG: AraC family transcriptional regulator [Nitrospira sp.]|nr:AraC family transcriptional regulator [Nitrospira sp.]